MKNTLTIAITKLYEIKVKATDIDLAFDEFLNTNPSKQLVKILLPEPTDFVVWTPKKRKPYKKYQHKGE